MLDQSAMPKHAGEWQQYMVYTAQALVMLPATVALLAMWAAMRSPHLLSSMLAMVIGAFAGIFFVLAYWATGMTHPNAVAGLIQWNDAAGYLSCARTLLAGVPLSEGCSMRPYYVAEFGAFLAASGGNVQVALLMQSALLSGTSGWFAYRIARHGGIPAGLVVFAALQVFIMQFTLPVLTENAGLLLGMLAIAILFARSASVTPSAFLIAMAILTLALNARAGAMLVLPGLLAWSVLLSNGDLRQRLVRSLYGVGGIILALAYNFGFNLVFGGAAEQAHSNFAYTLYALSAGKSTYLQIFFDHPEIKSLSSADARALMYNLAWENVIHRPELLLLGYLRGGAMWARGWFEFVPIFHLRAFFFVFGLFGLWSCLRSWRGERERLLLVMFASIAISAPFLFPYGGSRILAATFPVDALIVARGAIHLVGRSFVDIRMWSGRIPIDVLVAASIAVAPLPIAMGLRAAPLYSPLIADVECPAGQSPIVTDLEHTSVAVTLGVAGQTSIFPLVVERERFSKLVHPDTHQLEKLQNLPAGTTLFEVMQRLPRSDSNAYGTPMPFLWTGPVPKGVVKACIDVSPDLWLPVATSLTPIGR